MRGYPETRLGRAALRALAVVDLAVNLALMPAYALWYGLHETPDIARELRLPLKTIRHGRVGPFRGVTW